MRSMLNIAFSASVAGAIKWTHVQKPNDVFCIDFMLDAGKLSSGVCSSYRRTMYDFLYNQTFNFDDSPSGMFAPSDASDMGVIYDTNAEEYKRFMSRLETADNLRIWIGTGANDACSLRWICNEFELRGYSGSAYLMEAPVFDANYEVASGGYMEPSSLSEYDSCERELSFEKFSNYASEWRSLVAEDLMLRSVIEGKLKSVRHR